MTTKSSPIQLLKAQADKIASTLKAAERGDKIDVRFAAKINEALAKSVFKVGVVMDDKVIIIDISWETIRSATQAGLAAYIVDLMQEARH